MPNQLLTFVCSDTSMSGMRYVVTGGTGFIGRRVVSRLLTRPDTDTVHVLVRRRSLGRFEQLAREWDERVEPWSAT